MDDFLDFVHALRAEYASLKSLAERAAAQLDDEQFFAMLDPEANSVAMLMKHLGGNLRSRWREFRTTDGEKADRRRDTEFEIRESRGEIDQQWTEGWRVLQDALDGMTARDRTVQIVIRGNRRAFRARSPATCLTSPATFIRSSCWPSTGRGVPGRR